MAEYQNSSRTRQHLIEAAGELFAEKGIDAVTTREIAAHAGAAPNSITYHFNGIDGLIREVWAYVSREWEPERFAVYLEDHRHLLTCDAGRQSLIRGAVEFLFQIMLCDNRPLWINKFLVRSALSDQGRNCIAKTVSGGIVPELCRLYAELSGQQDSDRALCWCLHILAAPMVMTANLTAFAQLYKGRGLNRPLYRMLLETTIRNAIFEAGLPPEEWNETLSSAPGRIDQ